MKISREWQLRDESFSSIILLLQKKEKNHLGAPFVRREPNGTLSAPANVESGRDMKKADFTNLNSQPEEG